MSVVPDANVRDHRREEEQSDDQTADRCGAVDDDGRGGDTRRGLRGGERSEGARRAGARAAAGAGAVAAAVAAASGATSVRVWHITSRGWDPWTERPLPEVVRVAYPPDAVHNHFLLSTDSSSVRPLP